jgi:hypothetical protein
MEQPAKVEAPVDSGDYPVSVLIQGDDIQLTTCGQCGRHADNWPGRQFGAFPGAMFQAELYCADCMPASYDPYEGDRVSTLTGS